MNNETNIEVVERLTRAEQQIKNNTDDIEELKNDTKAINKIAISVEVMANEMKGMSSKIEKVDAKVSGVSNEVSELKQIPVKRKSAIYDKVVGATLGVIGGGILAFVLAQLFPNIFS